MMIKLSLTIAIDAGRTTLRKGADAALAHTEWVDKAKRITLDAVAFRGF
jgi:hypothetical protein